MRLLTEPEAQTKAAKSKEEAVYVMHLWPNKIICPDSDECMKVCLKSAGRGQMESVRQGRYKRTRLWHKSPEDFMELLRKDLGLVRKRMMEGTGGRHDFKKAYVRLNGTSDVPWEKVDAFLPSLQWSGITNIMELFPEIEFYDYTKGYHRDVSGIENYSLTYSRGSSTSNQQVLDTVGLQRNVAVVFDKPPESWLGYPVINGDEHDLRPKDPSGVIVGLKAKGKAKGDESGFVVRLKGKMKV